MSAWWPTPVRVLIGPNKTYNVTSNEQAAELLLGDGWPNRKGARHLHARKAVLRSMEKPGDPGPMHGAMRAFEAAAREAGILME